MFHWLDRYFDLTTNDPFVLAFNRLRKWKNYLEDRQDEYLKSIGYEKGDIMNSYNGESNLTQVYTLTPIYPNSATCHDIYNHHYYLLSIHQWCDLRGWYTNDIMVKIDPDDFPREDVYWYISYTNNPDVSYPVSNLYDGNRIRYDEHDTKQNEEIDTENIQDFTLSLY
jgi:hypothetical protein